MTGEKITIVFGASLCILIVLTLAVTEYSFTKTKSVVVGVPSTVTATISDTVIASTTVPVSAPATDTRLATTTLWFTGDVMLARQVGELAERRGYHTPFVGVTSLFTSTSTEPQYTFVNFEGCLSPTSVFDYTEPLRFIVASSAISALRQMGITHTSLANNHALDCGATGFRHTNNVLSLAQVETFGHPNTISTTSVVYVAANDRTVAVIGLHTLGGLPGTSELEALFTTMASTSDLQIVYIHWGDEYSASANETQRSFARTLSALGADIIIGHHPHVVQNIEFINTTLVVYSLGNLIFDQYFSKAVQQGLLLRVRIGQTVQVELVPVTSLHSRTQPHVMTEGEKGIFLRDIATRSEETIRDSIINRQISLPQ